MARKKKKQSGNAGSASDETGKSGSLPPPVLRQVLKAISTWLDSANLKAAIVGGLAVNLHGITRQTDDVDILVFTMEPDKRVLASLERSGFVPRYSDPLEFALAARVLLVRHVDTGAQVDVMLGRIPFEQDCVDNSVEILWDDITVRVIPIDALCAMKLIAARNQDKRDVALLLETYPDINRHWILEHVMQFAELAEQPELVPSARELLRLP